MEGIFGAAIPLVLLYFLYDKAVQYIMVKFSILENIITFASGVDCISDLTPDRCGNGNRNRFPRKFLYGAQTSKEMLGGILDEVE